VKQVAWRAAVIGATVGVVGRAVPLNGSTNSSFTDVLQVAAKDLTVFVVAVTGFAL
jgi:hypothetical protein